VEEMLKRKREDTREDSRGVGEDILKKNNKTCRSLEVIGNKVEGSLESMMAKWRKEIKELIRGMKEVKEEIREQGGKLRKEMEEMRREFREQERRWAEERGEMGRWIKNLEEKVEALEKKKLDTEKKGKKERR